MQTTPTTCPVSSRWALDALADECTRTDALMAAEAEVDAARAAIEAAGPRSAAMGAALDRYILAVTERNALRAGRP